MADDAKAKVKLKVDESGPPIPVLDHGYVQLIEYWGSDERIIEAARMSTAKGFKGWGTPEEPGDEKLLRFLYEHKHFTPFEMGGLIIEVQAPIFVFREWHRHRTQSYNELSARYTPLPNLNYIPTVERLMINAGGSNKQAGTVSGSKALTPEMARAFQCELEITYDTLENQYQRSLRDGIPKELARVLIPVGRYSRMRASANLRNWLAFLTLRMDQGAQWEIRQYAHIVGSVVQQLFPRTYELFLEGSSNATRG